MMGCRLRLALMVLLFVSPAYAQPIERGEWDHIQSRGRHVFYWMHGPQPHTIWLRHEQTQLRTYESEIWRSRRYLFEVRCDDLTSRQLLEEHFSGQNLTEPVREDRNLGEWQEVDRFSPHGTAMRRYCGEPNAQPH
jgi:hypothetical protein